MIASAKERLQHAWKTWDNFEWRRFGIGFLRGAFVAMLGIVVLGYGSFRIAYAGKIFPGVRVASIDVSGMFPEEALYTIHNHLDDYMATNVHVMLTNENQDWQTFMENFSLSVDDVEMQRSLTGFGRSEGWLDQLNDQWMAFHEGILLPIELRADEGFVSDFVATASAQLTIPLVPPRVYKSDVIDPVTRSQVVVEAGSAGEYVDEQEIKKKLLTAFSLLATPIVSIDVSESQIIATDEQLEETRKRAETLIGKELQLVFDEPSTKDHQEWTLNDADLLSFLSPVDEFDASAVDAYVAGVKEAVNRPAENAAFQFNEALGKVEAFSPGKKGLSINTSHLQNMIMQSITKLVGEGVVEPIAISVSETNPKVSTGDVNSLGIEVLLGKGTSTYYGSIAPRRHNVELTAKKLNGVLVPPGETFSFNNALGDVSSHTGFQQAYIIKDGQTVLGDGGGVCQDSTTIFRAILDAGLPITEWRNHSYRVSYYEQGSKPGFDATVYSPLTDLKFLNDTPAHILIQAKAGNSTLEYELYGTSDGREAEIANYQMWGSSPPPPDRYQDDPSLPAGVIKQVEHSIPGLKTKFDYIVTRDGETIFEKTFYSTFVPWQAVYLRGTGGA